MWVALTPVVEPAATVATRPVVSAATAGADGVAAVVGAAAGAGVSEARSVWPDGAAELIEPPASVASTWWNWAAWAPDEGEGG